MLQSNGHPITALGPFLNPSSKLERSGIDNIVADLMINVNSTPASESCYNTKTFMAFTPTPKDVQDNISNSHKTLVWGFTCDNISEPEIRAKLEKISRVKSIVAGPLCLPNIHPKRRLESPPQFVAATSGTIVPQLSAPAMNCGMSVFTTNLTREDFSPEFLKEFAARLRAQVAPRVSKTRALLYWLGLNLDVKRPSEYDILKNELEDFFINGAEAAIKKYNLPESELDHVEYHGCVLSEEEKRAINLKTLVPRSSYTNGRHEMGYNFGGNHFLEIHCVEKILDESRAREFGLKEKQLVMMYHGGGGHATYHLGRYFARREKNTRGQKFVLFWLKLLFHFSSLEGIKNFSARWHAYFSHKPFPEIPLDSPEGKRLWQSIQIALNYGYAFRVALLRRISNALPKGEAHFLWDAAHNSIMKETLNDQELIVHRQDATRVFQNKPVMIAGNYNTLSYIGMGSAGAAKTFWSCTPSAAKTIEKQAQTPDSAHFTLVSKRKNPELKKIDHIKSDGLLEVVQELETEDIIKPVCYLRPLGGIKGH